MNSRKKNYASTKRIIDIVGAGLGLVVLSPVIAGVSLAVKAKLGSPVIFKQERPGKDEKIFTLYKFRSMRDIDEAAGLVSNEDRITPFGKKLRATSLDELPSLWNVLRGEMSLVGPRPLHVRYLERYDDRQRRRHEVRPGITGLAQVGGRNLLQWSDRFERDIEYVETQSFALDARVLFLTVKEVFQKSGITAEGSVASSEFNGNLTPSQGTGGAE
ncbi:sugar transferase [Yaniella halotolerans]|uniref:sugar transferase n=1 Tax=Yaniella halotolerans TaxID=225453 RepID=UPI0003B53F4C|nr:sugar transferase [Yaniella halotolerans]